MAFKSRSISFSRVTACWWHRIFAVSSAIRCRAQALKSGGVVPSITRPPMSSRLVFIFRWYSTYINRYMSFSE